jgi:predicted ABC-type ATPase
MSKRILIIAGPNGAGKTTFAREYLPNEANLPTFINADLIAAGLSPFNPAAAAVHAGRLMLAEIDDHVRRGESFSFETTLNGRGYSRRIEEWKRLGYRFGLIFLSLPTPEAAIDRVAKRVSQGGHDVSEDVVRRRFHSGRKNFEEIYRTIVDSWTMYDAFEKSPRIIDTYESGH